MKIQYTFFLSYFFICLFLNKAHAGSLTDNQVITSERLGYKLQYRVWRPENKSLDIKSILFVTDGQMYIRNGKILSKLVELTNEKKINPSLVVFVDSRNPDNLIENRRNNEFMCNKSYARFYTDELLPEIREHYKVAADRESTAILGVSFGGLNSACFSLFANKHFSKFGMHSPANDRHLKIVSKLYEAAGELGSAKVYISVGTENDNFLAVKKFSRVLKSNGFDVTFKINRGARHDWDNWEKLMGKTLITLLNEE